MNFSFTPANVKLLIKLKQRIMLEAYGDATDIFHSGKAANFYQTLPPRRIRSEIQFISMG